MYSRQELETKICGIHSATAAGLRTRKLILSGPLCKGVWGLIRLFKRAFNIGNRSVAVLEQRVEALLL
jgi:hypothetical protein